MQPGENIIQGLKKKVRLCDILIILIDKQSVVSKSEKEETIMQALRHYGMI